MTTLQEQNPKVLYLPSTPLNILVSVAHALAHADSQNARIVLIDQKNIQDNIYFKILNEWKDSPFEQVLLTSGSARGFQKVVERKANFKTLAKLAKEFPANAIAVGSDRRVEFQYLMHLRTDDRGGVEGWYLDDGLYSYAGRPYRWFKDSINSILKKLSYGFWWQEPKTVGSSNWIYKAWLFSPENAIEAIQQKECHQIVTEWFVIDQIKGFSQTICKAFGLLLTEDESDVFILIPHPNNIEKMPGYLAKIEHFLANLNNHNLSVSIKYHPRTESEDPYNFKERYGVKLIPSALAFEFVLPLLKSKSFVIGDVGTSLLTAKWLRPDVNNIAVLNKDSQFEVRFLKIMQKLDVRVKGSFDEALELING
ncbi:polysialyltransferase family glycosyltransferase [Thiomicrorhabdus sp. Kp2]|uniref:polysialyltransferase family glycosyltransferase n=1 Tax=Thiomicrorhabdus sp. Kp2 TaxID=1123518 RepID=UPI000417570E|nr:polysialyltransferase family glycosyltransferase [Thiomicrorhabdus sp. Kp2]